MSELVEKTLANLQKRFSLTPMEDCYRASNDRTTGLVNIRWKTKPVWSRARKRWEFGIPKVRWDAYCRMAATSPFALFVAEKQSGLVYMTELKRIAPDVATFVGFNAPDDGGTVFIPKDGMTPVEV